MKPEGARLTSAGVKHFNLRQQLLSLYLQRFGPVRKHVQSKRVPAASCVITWLWSPTKVAMKKKKSFWHVQVNYHLARQLDFQDNFSNEGNVLACSNKLVEVSQSVMLLL